MRVGARRTESGFTLLEILLSLAILAIVTGAAVLALGGAPDRDAAAAVRRLTAQLQYAVDDALVADRDLALVPDPKIGYRFVAWNPSQRAWIADSDPELSGKDRTPGAGLSLAGLGSSGVIRFRPAGESDPFALVLTAGGQVWRIASDGVNVTMANADAP